MNYRDVMREYLRCPQLGDLHYGKWGPLNLEQRLLITKLLDEMDSADEVIKMLWTENEALKAELEKKNGKN